LNIYKNKISTTAKCSFCLFVVAIININALSQDSISVGNVDSTFTLTDGIDIIDKSQDSLKDTRRVYLNRVQRSSVTAGKGKVRFIQDERISSLDQIITEQPYDHDGFRVQILFGSKTVVNNKKASFESKFSYRTYVDYLPPNFRLRVGDFPTKQLAEKHLYNIRKSFPNSYIVKDKINTPSDYK
jgi:hypothetical protein